jgi:hypothetical protein
MKNMLRPGAQIARDIGILTSKQLAKGLADSRPEVRQEAQRVQALAEQELAQLIQGGGKAGRKAMEELREGLRSKNPEVRAAAERVKAIIEGRFEAVNGVAAGKDIDREVATGMNTGKGPVYRAAADLARDIAAKIAGTIYSGRSAGTDEYRQAGGPVRAATPYWVNEQTRRSEMFVPSTSGYVLTHMDAMRAVTEAIAGSAGGGGDTYNIPLTVQGALPVRTIRDIATELQRAGDLGVVPERMLPPLYHRREAARG